jgi:hypothetical protein
MEKNIPEFLSKDEILFHAAINQLSVNEKNWFFDISEMAKTVLRH